MRKNLPNRLFNNNYLITKISNKNNRKKVFPFPMNPHPKSKQNFPKTPQATHPKVHTISTFSI
jgi:hypothetical protein